MGCGASGVATAKGPTSEVEVETEGCHGQTTASDHPIPTLKVQHMDDSPANIPSVNTRATTDMPKTARGSWLKAEMAGNGKILLSWQMKEDTHPGDGDWIGAFEGPASTALLHTDAPWWDISAKLNVHGGAIVLSVMTDGKATSRVETAAPDVPGEYHFRYFFRDREDEAAAVSNTLVYGEPSPEVSQASASPTRHLRRNSLTRKVSGDVSYCLWSANVTEPGFYPEEPAERKNQDAFCVHAGLNGDGNQHFFGVFDGHGPCGEQCSQYVRDNLVETVLQSAHFEDNLEKACHSAFRAVNLEMRREPTVDDCFSGTTAVTLIVRGRQIVVSNVGDSRAILARRETVETEEEGSKDIMKAYDLTNDQTPFREDERERVKACGAQVLTMDEVEGVKTGITPGQYVAEDPPLLWVPNTLYPGTAFTRSLGDMLAERIGVVATPEVLVQELGQDDRFIVLASDGVWEFMSSQEVVDIVTRCFTPLDAARAVVTEAKRLWLEMDCRTDDITCIVIFITGLQVCYFFVPPSDESIQHIRLQKN